MRDQEVTVVADEVAANERAVSDDTDGAYDSEDCDGFQQAPFRKRT